MVTDASQARISPVPRRWLVTGATGLLGPHLCAAAAAAGNAVVTSGAHGGDLPADLCVPGAAADLVAAARPDVVVHTVAWTDVDGCEADPELATARNTATTAAIAAACGDGVHLIAISTDQVYPDTPGPHAEGDEAPVNVYGATKFAAEAFVRDRTAGPGLVLRVNFFGPSATPGRRSFSDWIGDACRRGETIRGFTDVWFSPLHVATLAATIVACGDAGLAGTYNCGSRDGMTKFAAARLIAIRAGFAADVVSPAVSAELTGRALRPRDLRMDPTRLETALGHPMPTTAEEIDKL